MGYTFPVLTERQVIGGGRRPSACYQCGSADRERLVYLYLRDHGGLADAASKRVLHIAPEKRLSAALLDQGFAEYVRGDLHMEGYKYPPEVQNIDATDIPFDDDSFDLVICNHVLEHIPTDDVAMKELCRVLRPGGTAILQVPISASTAETFEDPSVTDPKQREVVFGQFDHVRIYGQDYADRLKAAGFTVAPVNVSSDYAEFGVNPQEDLYACTK